MLMFYLTIVNKTLRHRHSRKHNSNISSKWFRFAFVQNAIFPNFNGSKGVAFEQNWTVESLLDRLNETKLSPSRGFV